MRHWLARALGRREGTGCAILMYHRINQPGPDPWSLCVAPEHFSEHLDVLARVARVVPLSELAERHVRGTSRRGDVAITFDDGYVDNLQNAAPALASRGMPATAFVTTGGIDAAQEFWWDALERVFLSTDHLPLTLRLGGRSWNVEACEPGVIGWRADTPPIGSRTRAYVDVWHALYAMAPDERARRVSEILEWATVPSQGRETHRTLTTSELRALPAAGIAVGAHTVTHPALTGLSSDARSMEIAQSRRQLEELLGVAPAGFAFPHGAFDPSIAELVRSCGFQHASTTVATALRPTSSCFELPRLQVNDMDGARFEAWMRWWTDW